MWRVRRGQAELAEEIESHRQLIEQRLRESGMSAAEAASASRRAMGNVTLAREDARSEVVAPWIDSVGQDVAYAFRLLRRAPGFSAAMILVMAIGIGAATAIFGLIDRLLLKSLPGREPEETPRSIAYLPWRQERTENLFTEIRAAGPAGSLGDSIRREVRRLDSIVPMRLETVNDRIRESLVTERVMALLAAALAFASVILASAALYGLLAYAVSRRTREIGVRLALGAARSSVLRTVIADSLTLAALGIVAGIAASLWIGRIAATLLFHVSPRDPASLLAAAGIMLAVAAVAGLVPARRASRVDPVIALKCE